MSQQVRLGDFIGSELEEDFVNFDLTEIQQVLRCLQESDAIDLAHAEMLQQQSLRGADILTEYYPGADAGNPPADPPPNL